MNILYLASDKEFLIETLGFNEGKTKAATRRTPTLDNGVLEERANWPKERLNMKDSAIEKKLKPSGYSWATTRH